MTEEIAARIERAEDAFSHYGYIVTSAPIVGMEGVYADKLWCGVKRIEEFLGNRHGKKSIALLHKFMPAPCWGVEVCAA